ncbi:MAG: anhydro-N-acetylmuramic acid kinase [Chitinophagaceae bacterium]|jgi:anhydro-N-acetylmuramic acid kinase|nr:anhydro-N-acetylmuramic acid kinase [Chitinophagaceae bacterium]OQY96287.1 MAG: anhydro-N-acetylmuramic acid kinase [Sphingobacteriales bacterium UTBCD1]
MVYKVIGLMSGSSLDGLDIAFVEFHENGGKWSFRILKADCYPYVPEMVRRLREATGLSALEYLLLHAEYGHYIGKEVNRFIEENGLHYQVSLVTSHGHTTFHLPAKKMTGALGDGAAIAAETRLPVVTDLRAMDVALGGQGAPIVPIGEKLLFTDYDYFLNIGGIANISVSGEKYIAFDVCAANRVLNMLANLAGKEFDEGGKMAASGIVHQKVLNALNSLDYYKLPYPKSLANDFGTDTVFPILHQSGISIADALRTYTEHIIIQLKNSLAGFAGFKPGNRKLLVTGGGALNIFLMERARQELGTLNMEVAVPEKELVNFKEALIMAFIGVLRWRQEYNVLSSVTGAIRDSIGGALWTGHEE